MITETEMREAIFDWLQPVLDLWIDTGATPRASGQCQLVWHMQQEPRVKTPILMGRISAYSGPMFDYFSQPEVEGEYIVSKQIGNRDFMLYLEYFGEDSISQLMKVKSAAANLGTMRPLHSAGIAVIRSHDIIDAHAFLGTIPEDRAMMDLEFRTTAEIDYSSTEGIIERVKAEGNIEGDLNTITIDVSTISIN